MKNKVEAIRARILEGNKFERTSRLWAGAGLAISYEPVSGMQGKVVVVTEYAAELSSLVYALKNACSDWLDYMNKYTFYPILGEAAIAYLAKANDLKGLMLCVIDEARRLEDQLNRYLYFAYGSNMDEEQMEVRCPGAEVVEKMTLRDFRFVLDESGVATIIPEKGARVEGLLWMITPQNLQALDRYEGVAHGCYRRERIEIETQKVSGTAIVYISNRPVGPVWERSGYMQRIIRAAEDHGFSEEYIAELKDHYDLLKEDDFE